jgi:hypothetical protein
MPTMTTNRPARARSARARAPRDRDFVDVVLRPLAARAADGEDRNRLSVELYEQIHPWAMRKARAMTVGLPPHADTGEVVSQTLRLAWEACVRIDWTRVESWPALLEGKVAHARIEAARTEDWLSRRERIHRRRFQAAVAAIEQREGRVLSSAERHEVARSVSPASGRVDWAAELMAGRHPSSVAELPELEAEVDVAECVERDLMRVARKAGLHRWLAMLASAEPRLAEQLVEWSGSVGEANRSLPVRLRDRLAVYVPMLAGLVEP